MTSEKTSTLAPGGAKYMPEIVVRDGIWVAVSGNVAYPPGMHPAHCPLVKDCYAVESITPLGSRWHGGTNAYIDSTLRMVIVGYSGAESASWLAAE
jgi:hypothetical protein